MNEHTQVRAALAQRESLPSVSDMVEAWIEAAPVAGGTFELRECEDGWEVLFLPPRPVAIPLGNFTERAVAEHVAAYLQLQHDIEVEALSAIPTAGYTTKGDGGQERWDPATGHASVLECDLTGAKLPYATAADLEAALHEHFRQHSQFRPVMWGPPVGDWLSAWRKEGVFAFERNGKQDWIIRPASQDTREGESGTAREASSTDGGTSDAAAAAPNVGVQPAPPHPTQAKPEEASEPTQGPQAAEPGSRPSDAADVARPQPAGAALPAGVYLLPVMDGEPIEFRDEDELLGALTERRKPVYLEKLGIDAHDQHVRLLLRKLRDDGHIRVEADKASQSFFVEAVHADLDEAEPAEPTEATLTSGSKGPQTPEDVRSTDRTHASGAAVSDLDPRVAEGVRAHLRKLVAPLAGIDLKTLCAKAACTEAEVEIMARRGDLALIRFNGKAHVFPERANPTMGKVSSNGRKLYSVLREKRDPDGATRLSYIDMGALLPRPARAKARDLLKELIDARLVNVLCGDAGAGLPLIMRVVT